jgi:hypothetical protein
MNRKQLLILIVVVAIVGGAGLALWKKDQGEWNKSPRKQERLLPGFPVNDVAQVQIKSATAEVNLVKKADRWLVQERFGFPANFGEISEFLRKLWEMKPGDSVEVGQSQLGRLELLDPAKGSNSATKVEFKDKNGKVVSLLLLGKKHMKSSPSPSPMGGGDWPDGRYLMVSNDLQSVCLVKETFSNVEPKPETWLDKEFIKVEKIKTISLVSTNATNSWKLSRETEAGEWKLAGTTTNEPLDSVKASAAGTAMMSPSFADVVSRDEKPEATGLDHPTVVTLETFDNFVYTLRFGKTTADGNNYYMDFNVQLNYPNQRIAGKDEKPEDKEKLDKEFKAELKKLGEKRDKEKALEKWAYQVGKWSVEPLVKARHELLAAKKEEAKPDAQPEPAKP